MFLLRADQYQEDPSAWFVMPVVNIMSLNSGSHPIRLIGSRGSGKTMILRSIAGKPLGESIPDDNAQAINRLRIYIRPDNQLMGAMQGWGLNQSIWIVASVELMLLKIFEEATNKINYWLENKGMDRLRFDSEDFSFNNEGCDLAEWIRLKQHTLYKWARCPEGNPPIVVAALSSLSALIKSLEKFIDNFPKNISVSVYIDEQETYLEYQEVIINDWIKNPPEGWVFHVAHRRYFEYVRKTSTDETIDQSNDFREIDLDLPLVDSQSDSKKAREKFYEKLIHYEIKGLGLDESEFNFKNFIPRSFLPSERSNHEKVLRKNKWAKEAWKRLTENASKLVGIDPQKTVEVGNSLSDDRLWVLWPVLVARGKNDNIDELKLKDYFHNHLNGAILQIYFESKGRAPMDYYSGFSTLCSIVLSNVREFILILQQAIEYEHQEDGPQKNLVDILKNGISSTNQYRAVMIRSKHFNNVVAISAAEHGNNIEKALDNWIEFFSLYQMQPTLPYNEPNHIVCSDSIDKSSPAWKIIEAGEKHGAFIFTLPSKQRESTKLNQTDIRIHPLLAAKHYLSYAKRNTPVLSFEEISSLTTTTDRNVVKSLVNIKRIVNKNRVKDNIPRQRSLFEGDSF